MKPPPSFTQTIGHPAAGRSRLKVSNRLGDITGHLTERAFAGPDGIADRATGGDQHRAPSALPQMRKDVHHVAVFVSEEESSGTPVLVCQRMHDFKTKIHDPLVGAIDVLNLDRCHRIDGCGLITLHHAELGHRSIVTQGGDPAVIHQYVKAQRGRVTVHRSFDVRHSQYRNRSRQFHVGIVGRRRCAARS